MCPLKILIVDDHRLFNEGLKSLLSLEENLVVVGQLYNENGIDHQIQQTGTNVLILDLKLGEKNGLEVGQKLLADFPNLKILACTMHAEKQWVKAAEKAGFSGYVLKTSPHEELLYVLHQIQKPGFCLDRNLKFDKPTPMNTLTLKEQEVCEYLRQGLDSVQIAAKMGLSYLTVKTHRRNIHFKLGTSTTAELVSYLIKNGIG